MISKNITIFLLITPVFLGFTLSLPLSPLSQVLRCPLKTSSQITALEQRDDLDIWSHGIQLNTDVDLHVVNKEEREWVHRLLGECKTLIKDVQKAEKGSVMRKFEPWKRIGDKQFFLDFQVCYLSHLTSSQFFNIFLFLIIFTFCKPSASLPELRNNC